MAQGCLCSLPSRPVVAVVAVKGSSSLRADHAMPACMRPPESFAPAPLFTAVHTQHLHASIRSIRRYGSQRRPSCPCRCMPDPATELARDHCWPRPFMAGPHVPVAPCTRTRTERYQCVCRASCCCLLRSCCYVRSTAFFFRPCLAVSSEGIKTL